MAEQRTDQTLVLKDGRVLGYADFGAPEGMPVFYFHGFPGSRLDYLLSDDGQAATSAHTRIIAVDRPGMGLSDSKRGRTILDWPADVVALAEALQIERFAVLGISGGGPYAAACACRLPERLTAAGIVCGMGPAHAPGMADGVSWTLPRQPAMVRRFILLLTAMGLQRDPAQFVSRSKETLSEPDRKLLDQPEVEALFVRGLQEAFRTGVGGVNQEASLYTRPWGFRMEEIRAQVHLWHGGRDLNVPVSVGQYVAGALPGCEARFFGEEGHLTLPRSRMGQILAALAL